MNTKPGIAVLYHIFYEDSLELVCGELQALLGYKPAFIFNICSDTPGKASMADGLKKVFPGSQVIFTSNKGKDIGAKLALLQLLLELRLDPDYLLMLHDKKSLQALKNATWKNDLLKIIDAARIETVLQHLSSNSSCGMVATKEYIISEPYENDHFIGINGNIMAGLLQTYRLKPPSFEFVAGTMFWAKAAPVLAFFRQNNPLVIRASLEDGNVIDNFSGTVTHSWERLLSWILTSEKFYIKGI